MANPALLLALAVGLSAATATATAPVVAAPVPAAKPSPIRWNTGAAVWTTTPAALATFLRSGDITDRGLEGGLNRSGWTSQQVRQGLTRTYSVDFIGLSRFLYAPAGVSFLEQQTRSYVPYATLKSQAPEALRSAIVADAADGEISAAGILAALPVDFRLADISAQPPLDGAQNVWPR